MNIKILLAAALMFSLGACQESQEHQHDHAATETHGHEHTHDTQALALNNGVKWQTDENTRQHAANLEGIAAAFTYDQSTPLEAYQKHAAAMQTELDYLIQDCRMKGPEHDALHLWLEPVLSDTRSLSEATDAAVAKTATDKLHEDIRKFPQYFQ